ncbi:hypothetical protein BDQ17DRAFT_1342050 [Cyathus striatus]|nr:hypothetical protein BDQ17DRAFT_1342050 [Cyathus striatus]
MISSTIYTHPSENKFHNELCVEDPSSRHKAHVINLGKNISISTSSVTTTSIAYAKSAVEDLPEDILVEIFMACRGEEGIQVGKKDIIHKLAEVNKRWREVIFCESRLWAKFILKLEGNLPDLQQNMRALLNRSRNSPLIFTLEFLPISFVCTEKIKITNREHLLRELALHSERWQNVTFRGPLMHSYADALNEAKGKLGLLKSATFTTRPYGPVLTIFETAPMLSGLAFMNFDDPKRYMLLPWKQLTRLLMGPSQFFMGVFVDVLRRCPRLEELEWSGDCTLTISTEYQPFVLPHLRVLRIETGILYLGKMLDAISAPSLKTLDVTLERLVKFGQEALTNSIILFLVRSCCAVTTLSLGSLLVESVVRILKEYPIIENLKLNSLIFSPYLEGQLIWLGHGIPCIAPNLRSLALYDCFITCAELEKIVRSRITGKCHTCLIRSREDEQCKVMRLHRVSLCSVQYYDKTTRRAEESLLYRFGNQTELEFTVR